MFIGQPAEERAGREGDDGGWPLYPLPETGYRDLDPRSRHHAVRHGRGWSRATILANSDSVDLTIYGKGGHGAYPNTTVDPS